MPFVFDRSTQLERFAKRRKLFHISNMARSNLKNDSEPVWLDTGESSGQPDRSYPAYKDEPEKEEIRTSSREELIECIKRGQKPTWVPKPSLQALCEEEDALQERRNNANTEAGVFVMDPGYTQLPDQPLSDTSPIIDTRPDGSVPRPHSALHRGDFSETNTSPPLEQHRIASRSSDPFASSLASLSSSPQWSPHGLSSTVFGRAISDSPNDSHTTPKLQTRRRAPSIGSSLSSSFVMRVPTSPLVNATTYDYLDLEDGELKASSKSKDYGNRRRTMPPNSFHSFSTSFMETTPPNFSRPLPSSLRRESSMPEQAHQPRRSLSSFTYQPRSNPASPLPRSRRPSVGSETSIRRRSSMVGSFEESILRGRMSTPPSKPLNFVAQIGVMGKGDCPPSLKCPAHVSVPFPAVFYNYESTAASRSLIDDAPSPYVGTIDLEHSLNPVTVRTKTKNLKRKGKTKTSDSERDSSKGSEGRVAHEEHRCKDSNIGGAYRVPQQGQLQIILKNPNKTAVKLFLIPYDLTDMQTGTKTFVRQRSFSSGPIIEKPLSEKGSQSTASDPLDEKLILRYLVHVKFCCPVKDRYYLYDNVRVVFANRVPDGKEKLRNEIQLPEPKFSPFKPTDASSKIMKTPVHDNTHTAAYPSSILPGRMLRNMDVLDGLVNNQDHTQTMQQTEKMHFVQRSRPRSPSFEPYMFSAPSRKIVQDFSLTDASTIEKIGQSWTISPVTGFKAYDRTRSSPTPWAPSSDSSTIRSYSPAPAEPGDGLLSRKFRELSENGTILTKLVTNDGIRNGHTSKQYRQEDMSRDGDIGLAHTFYIRNDHGRDNF